MAHTEHDSHHIIPMKILLRVFGGLVVLTVLTVVVARIDLGVLDLPVALGIAGAKSALVVLFFMALKYDKGVNSMVFTVGTVFVAVFLFFTLLDVSFRGDLDNVATETISAQERRAEDLKAEEPADSLLRIAPADYPNAPAAGADTTTGGARFACHTVVPFHYAAPALRPRFN
ncbi:MAG: oxidase [Bacteroidetes bacterium QH_2_67_10]|nr:MAG: oxidase [Bacteroidetes bacterium QH_2_67_10]